MVIPSHNRADVLPRAIRSVLAQSPAPAEVIVADDASTDGTQAVLAGFPQVRRVALSARGGANAARNAGIQASAGELVAFLDSDDEWLPGKLAAQLEQLRDRSLTASFTNMEWVDERGSATVPPLRALAPGVKELCTYNAVRSTSTVIVRRDALLECGGFDESMPSLQDWDLWLRIARAHRFQGIDRPLVRYHLHAGQLTRDLDKVFRGLLAFHDKHRGTLERLCTPAELRQWKLTLARQALLTSRYAQSVRFQEEAIALGGSRGDRTVLALSRHAPGLLRHAALARRKVLSLTRRPGEFR